MTSALIPTVKRDLITLSLKRPMAIVETPLTVGAMLNLFRKMMRGATAT